MSNIYDKLGQERKKMQEDGVMPEWYSTGGWQLFKERYMYQASNPREQYERIARTLSQHTPDPEKWNKDFFNLLWKGWLSPSTPVLSNTGTSRGLPVSCAGSYISDSISDIYLAKHEVAMLTKYGFGTASYLGDIRPRGTKISVGGEAEGVLPIIQGIQKDMEYVSQGNARRGSWAGYLPIDHGDFEEVCTYLESNPDGNNIGWNVSQDFTDKLLERDEDALHRYKKALKTKMVTGKGYYFFPDKAAEKRPQWYKDQGLDVKAPQLCVAPETRILTRTGYQEISELEDEWLDIWNGFEWSNVQVRKTGVNQKLLKVTTNCGFELECTPEHKFYVHDRNSGKSIEVRASELKTGDKLMKCNFPIIQGDIELENAYANGFYSGDGCPTKSGKRIYLYHEKRDLKQHLGDIFDDWCIQENQNREYGHSSALRDKYFVPLSNYTIESRLEWLAGICDSDGTVARNGKTQSIQIGNTNKEFLLDTQMMLQTMGISSKVTLSKEAGYNKLPLNDGSGELGDFYTKTCYRLLIGNYGVVQLQDLGFKTNRLDLSDHKPNRECNHFAKVVSVEDEGRIDDTYCFTEPKRHLGVFNGIVTGQCNEIMLHSSEDYTYTCVLSSMNLSKWGEWKDTNAVFAATVFLDCVVQEFIERAKNIKGLEKAVAFTKKSRALGLGACGYHTYMQENMIPFESIEAQLWNIEVFTHLNDESKKASAWVAEQYGEPEWMKGYGYANTHRLAVAPTKSTALIMGGISEGINPDTAFVYTQRTPAGEIDRVNPVLLRIMKERGVYNKTVVTAIREAMGGVQWVDWLTEDEKEVFKTAFEIDQMMVIKQASRRSQEIDQYQSLNTFFAAGSSEAKINEVHKAAFLDPHILGLYYVYSQAGVQASSDKDECLSCQ